jgi:RNA polymerase sigma factor (sigma-70 family)
LSFRPRPEHELDALSDDELIAYIRHARAAGAREAARVALQILVFGHWELVVARLRMKLPAHAVEDTAGDVIARAITSTFAGESVGEFRAWLATILRRAIVDFYRGRERTLAADPLFCDDDDDRPGREPSAADHAGYVEAQMVIESVLDELRDDHRAVVDIVVMQGRSADDACAEVPGMTPDNAYQIVRRFRVRLREALEGENG